MSKFHIARPVRTAETQDMYCLPESTRWKDVVKMRPFQPVFNFVTMGEKTVPTVKPESKKG